MNGFPVQFPTASAMPQVRLAQPGWTPAPRQQPTTRLLPRPTSSAHMAPLGQGEAQLVARGADITFSILAGVAAIVSGVAVMVQFGKGEAGTGTMVREGRMTPGRAAKGAKPAWYVVGGIVSLLGLANIWSSINRASAIQPQAFSPAPTNQTGG